MDNKKWNIELSLERGVGEFTIDFRINTNETRSIIKQIISKEELYATEKQLTSIAMFLSRTFIKSFQDEITMDLMRILHEEQKNTGNYESNSQRNEKGNRC